MRSPLTVVRLADHFGQYVLTLTCTCSHSRTAQPQKLSRLAGRDTVLSDVVRRQRCSECGKQNWLARTSSRRSFIAARPLRVQQLYACVSESPHPAAAMTYPLQASYGASFMSQALHDGNRELLEISDKAPPIIKSQRCTGGWTPSTAERRSIRQVGRWRRGLLRSLLRKRGSSRQINLHRTHANSRAAPRGRSKR
jgi:hypothetical protein